MSAGASPTTAADGAEVLSLLRALSRLLLKWSWEGVVGYEEAVEHARLLESTGYSHRRNV